MSVKLQTIALSNGETLGYRKREGGHVPLLLVHGNMTSSKHWDVLIDALPAQYKIVAVDLRGFGLSTYHQPIETLKDFSDDVKLFVDSIGWQRFALMGWSLGGGVAMQFAADYPEYVEKLVLLASASTRGYPFFEMNGKGEIVKRCETIEEVKKEPSKTIPVAEAYRTKNKEFLKQMWNFVIYTHHQPDEKKYDEYLDDMCTQRNIADVYQALNIFNISHHHNGLTDGNGLVDRIPSPVLILWGENDLVVTEQMTKEIIEDLGEKAETVVLKGCGHSPLIDDLNQLVGAVDRFLQ
ncbi:MAG: alpha/beta fold hydrolase [Tuberibacillus sp.]